jgi:tetratricopeptide (TPR) repeat protein
LNSAFNSADILLALDRAIKSRAFERSERARDLLAYLVNQGLAGKSDGIKGFSIVMDVFGKGADFDPATDPLVRVHAGRLRELLSNYYAEEGKDEPIVISIPTGRYVPAHADGASSNAKENKDEISVAAEDISSREPSVAKQELAPSIRRSGFSIRKIALMFLAILVLGLVALFITDIPSRLWNRVTVDRKDAIQDVRASVSQLPVVQVITDVEDQELVAFADRLNSGLSAFDTITTLQTRPLSVLDRRRGQWGDLEYSLKLTKTGNNSAAGNPIILVELLSLAENKVMRAEEYPIDIWDQPENTRLVAQKLTNVASPEGSIYADIIAKGDTNPVMDCLGKVRTYYGLSNRNTHKIAYECTKVLSEQEGVSGLIFATYGGLIAEASGKSYDYPDLPDEPEEAMRLALNTALKGSDLDPLSARAAREVGFVYSWQGAFSVMSEWFARANELNPNDTSVAASYGYGLVLSGEYSKAIPIFKNAIGASTRHPSWWDFYFALALLMEERFEEANEAIIPMGLSKRSLLYSMLNAVLAFRQGNRHRSAFLVRSLRERYPKFAADPRGNFQNRHFPQDLINNLVEALEKSGLKGNR